MFTTLYINQFGKTTKNKDEAFMKRIILFRTKRFKIFIHQFFRNDENALHSHPAHFISFMFWGSYIEEVFHPDGNLFIERKAPSVMFRDAYSFHRIKLNGKKPWTICFWWSANKNWHYLDNQTKKEIKWRKYINNYKHH